jgi:hypothetical protein
MASHGNSIVLINNPTGQPVSADGVKGIVCQATAVASTFVLGTSYLLTQESDIDTLGITAVNNPALYQQITEFYEQAGDGAKLWVTGISTGTSFATYVASAAFKTMIRGTGIADILNLVKGIGFCYAIPTTEQSSTDFPTDVTATIPLFQTALNEMFLEGYQLYGVIDGYNMSSTVSIANLGTMADKNAYKIGLCITGSKGNGISSVGSLLGKLARISVGTSVGKIKDGPIAPQTMYLTNGINIAAGSNMVVDQYYTVAGGAITYNGTVYEIDDVFQCVTGHLTFTTSAGGYVIHNSTSVKSMNQNDFTNLGNKQFIFARTWGSEPGYYWNDGATCTALTDAFANIEYNRVANKLAADGISYWTKEIGTNIIVDTATGNADSGYLGGKNEKYKSIYVQPLKDNGDITDARMTSTGINYTSNKSISWKLEIVPAPALSNVNGTIEYVNSLT